MSNLSYCKKQLFGFLPQGLSHTSGGCHTDTRKEEVDHWQTRMAEHKVPIEKGPVFNPDLQIYQMFLRDPNGYLIEIQRFEDPQWQN